MRARVRAAKPTIVTVDAALADGTSLHGRGEIAVRDLLIAGLGDSVASGEGNPDRRSRSPTTASASGVFLGSTRSEYFRPGRAGYRGNKSCESQGAGTAADRTWGANAARWMSAACHRSLYSYQLRTALALAIEDRHAAVTFLPLACTGAQIEDGLFKQRAARECQGAGKCATTVPAQLSQLKELLALARAPGRPQARSPPLTIGANDLYFSGLWSPTRS